MPPFGETKKSPKPDPCEWATQRSQSLRVSTAEAAGPPGAATKAPGAGVGSAGVGLGLRGQGLWVTLHVLDHGQLPSLCQASVYPSVNGDSNKTYR